MHRALRSLHFTYNFPVEEINSELLDCVLAVPLDDFPPELCEVEVFPVVADALVEVLQLVPERRHKSRVGMPLKKEKRT